MCEPRKRVRQSACAAVMLVLQAGLFGPVAAVELEPLPAEAGIDFARAPSAGAAVFLELARQPVFDFEDVLATPFKAFGAPGVAVLDYDGDGDLDIYVTNGPDAGNALYSNEGVRDGVLRFVDRAREAGVLAMAQDSTGVCFGDTDNDGDEDLYVLGRQEPNRFFVNQGEGRFEDITADSGAGGGARTSSSCAMGDVNGDGLLDILVANSFDWTRQEAVFIEPFALNQHNQLFLNQGNNRFLDVSAASGIERLAGLPGEGLATITWSVALVDLDLDGDPDIVFADDNAAVPAARYGGVDRGFLRILENDGSGHFTDRTLEAGTQRFGDYMGLAFGDFDCNGGLDIFATNLGDYFISNMPGQPYTLGDMSSRWFLGQEGLRFTDPGVGDLVATPFAWGVSVPDLDNDGDLDIAFYGGMDVPLFVEASNAGAILENIDCSGRFAVDESYARARQARRNVQGMASADLDGDGRTDIISVSNFDMPEAVPLLPFPARWGSPFDERALFMPTFSPIGPGEFTWNGYLPLPGTLMVEMNRTQNDNRSVTLSLLGTAGLLKGGRSNRDGIGAVITVTPENGRPQRRPLAAGGGYASQDARVLVFGLGEEKHARAEVLWPGGTRNVFRLKAGGPWLLPELPCDDRKLDARQWKSCTAHALRHLHRRGLIGHRQMHALRHAAWKAYSAKR
ncbi:MAG TPA: CRTAC1 family protein [Gammaproteobacteria bacterium]|nr:CRTAC1 family protein [Gammaproteobacteria bacterium]